MPDLEHDRLAERLHSSAFAKSVGNTPLVKLEALSARLGIAVLGKLEFSNPGGSIKDRSALGIMEAALRARLVGPGTTVVESSSGNFGIALAHICAILGLTFRCVVDVRTTRQNVQILQALGATVEMIVEPNGGSYLAARLKRVQEILEREPGSYWPNQYANPENYKAHYTTMREIVDIAPETRYLFCAVSTCGTLRGCAEFVRSRSLSIRLCAVDAVGSVIFGGALGTRLLPGHGSAIVPPIWSRDLADEVFVVSDKESVAGCRYLARSDSLMAGASSGAVVSALERRSRSLSPGSHCVLIFPDRGERYLETVYDDEWVARQFGDV